MTKERDALIAAFSTLRALANNSLSPAMEKMARRGAGNCLHGLGISEYAGFKAEKPLGPTIEISATRNLE